MKKSNIAVIFTCVFILVSVLIAGCINVVNPSVPKTDGKGSVLVSFSNGKSALMPSLLDFDVYEFIFTKTGDGTKSVISKNRNESFVFSLDLGEEYSLVINAYKGSILEENLGATGTSPAFVVNVVTNVLVTLNGFITGGAGGTFSYNIVIPSGADVDKLELYQNESTTFELSADIVDGKISNSVDVPAGRYLLRVWLSMDLMEAEDYTGVIIYSNSVTYYGTDGEPIVFTVGDFRDSPDEGDKPERIYIWHGFNIEGAHHYFNNDRASDGFEEESNYERSRAVGHVYKTYTDNIGTWSDVLKLTPPTEKYHNQYPYGIMYPEGYEEGTLAMTYDLDVHTQGAIGTFTLSMWVKVEGGSADPTFCWVNTGGEDGNKYNTGDNPYRPWREVLGSRTYVIPRDDKWHYVEKTFEVYGGDEIGLMARESGNNCGLKDSTLYIRDLELIYNGTSVVDTGTGVKIAPVNFNLVIGKTRQMSANKDVSWSVSPQGVVTISSGGLVEAVAVGTATITAVSTEDAACTAQAIVNVLAPGSKYIALTFDDGPNGYWTPRFMDVLKEYDATATFFLVGNRVSGNSALMTEMVRLGHELGNHTYSHDNTWSKSVDTMVTELTDTQNLIYSNAGVWPKVMRAPVLWYTRDVNDSGYAWTWDSWEKQYGQNIQEAARKTGLALIDATLHQVNDFDTNPSAFNTLELFMERVRYIVEEGGSEWPILLLHDAANEETSVNTIKYLPNVLEWLQEQGFNIVSVSELVEKRKETLGIDWGLEPGRIYYRFDDIPEHVGRISILKDETVVSYFEEDDIKDIGYINIGLETQTTLNALVTTKTGAVSDQEVYWYSDQKGFVTINESTGVLTAVDTGSTTIRAVAGGKVVSLWVTVESGPIELDTILTWEEFEQSAAGSISGVGKTSAENNNMAYSGSGASYQIGSFHDYDNVLKLVPPAEGYPLAGIALTFDVPYSGLYTVSLDAYVERDDMTVLWYDCTKFEDAIFFRRDNDNLQQNQWTENINGTLFITKGATIGLLARRSEDTPVDTVYGLKNSVIYIKNFKLELQGSENPVIDIESEVAAIVPVVKTVTLEWEKDGRLISGEDSFTIVSGQSIRFITAAVYPDYEWRIDGWEVPGNNGRSFIFDSSGWRPKKYTVSLWVNGNVAGDAVEVTVVEAE